MAQPTRPIVAPVTRADLDKKPAEVAAPDRALRLAFLQRHLPEIGAAALEKVARFLRLTEVPAHVTLADHQFAEQDGMLSGFVVLLFMFFELGHGQLEKGHALVQPVADIMEHEQAGEREPHHPAFAEHHGREAEQGDAGERPRGRRVIW